jgi:HAD superfamily hydrolase (TIGR01484 family)
MGETIYRLLAVDVDGTLMNSRNELPAANRDALHRAHEAGLFVCLCTGRSFTETRPVIAGLGVALDAAVCAFGAIVAAARTGRTLHRSPIPRRTAMRILEFFAQREYPVLVLQDVTEAQTDYYLVAGTRNEAAYDRWLALAPARTVRVDTWPADAPEPVRIGIIDEPHRVECVHAEFAEAFSPTEVKFNPIYAPNYGLYVLECFAPQVNKWHGIEQLVRDQGITPAEVVAIGDDVNDLEMIRTAGLGVAMGNASPVIQEAARERTGTNDESGLAAFVDRLLGGDVSAGPAER